MTVVRVRLDGMIDGEKILSQFAHFSHGRDLLPGIKQEALLREFGGVFYGIAMGRQPIFTADKAAYLKVR